MTVLSLFDGISCGQQALEKIGIKVDKYYASEIEKNAIKITMKNYPDTIQLGDITKWKEWNIENPDIILAGSPCQDLSFAGKKAGIIEGKRSSLFFDFIDILKHYKPKYFLLENVMMTQENNDIISGTLGDIYPECVKQKELFRIGRLEPIQINSALVSAQNRERLYWTNIKGIEQPKDKGILLKDIIDNAETEREKSHCIDANYSKSGSVKDYLEKSRRQLVITGSALRGRNKENPSNRNQGIELEQKLEINKQGKSNCLTSVSKDNVVVYGKNYIQYDIKNSGNCSQAMRIFYKENKANCINVSHSSIPKLKEMETETEIFYRKLTPEECEKLQTVKVGYTSGVSNSARYKSLGNGWTVDVIVHILSYI